MNDNSERATVRDCFVVSIYAAIVSMTIAGLLVLEIIPGIAFNVGYLATMALAVWAVTSGSYIREALPGAGGVSNRD